MPQPDILGRNGTFAGFRKYQTRVGAFNRFLRANGSTEEERELVAAKLVGRWRSGAPLTLAPDVDNPTLGADPKRNNDFDYAKDPHGRQVPFGAHIRRMNPRDTELTRLTDVNLHRLIRRGTTYGPPYDPNALSEADDEVPRGAIFLFISAKAMATIEFLQQEWINDGNFIGAGNERDPIIGRQEEGATFTIPKQPVRRRIRGIETFNVLKGGEYFFVPSMSALKWLAISRVECDEHARSHRRGATIVMATHTVAQSRQAGHRESAARRAKREDPAAVAELFADAPELGEGAGQRDSSELTCASVAKRTQCRRESPVGRGVRVRARSRN